MNCCIDYMHSGGTEHSFDCLEEGNSTCCQMWRITEYSHGGRRHYSGCENHPDNQTNTPPWSRITITIEFS